MSNKWQGTPVPNSGYVENVYFNTALSVEEVMVVLNTIECVDMGPTGVSGYDVLHDDSDDGSAGIGIAITNGTTLITYANTPVFSSQDTLGFGFVGWNPDFTNPAVVNSNVVSEYDSGFAGIFSSGHQNDKLSSLFSTTPFVLVEDEPQYDWFRELFINEAKPALERHSGSKAPSYEETENEAGGITVTIGSKGE